jgi:hypothetical protein
LGMKAAVMENAKCRMAVHFRRRNSLVIAMTAISAY